MNGRAPAVAKPGHWRRYLLYAVIAICVAPVVASYLAFYVFPPSGRTNYGTLITPRPVPAMPMTLLDGRAFSVDQLAGKWVMVTAAPAACDDGVRVGTAADAPAAADDRQGARSHRAAMAE